jgi:hypothetical protein
MQWGVLDDPPNERLLSKILSAIKKGYKVATDDNSALIKWLSFATNLHEQLENEVHLPQRLATPTPSSNVDAVFVRPHSCRWERAKTRTAVTSPRTAYTSSGREKSLLSRVVVVFVWW